MNYIKTFCDEIDFDSDFLNEQVPEIRNEAIKRSSVKKMENEKSLSKALFAIIACHQSLNKMIMPKKNKQNLSGWRNCILNKHGMLKNINALRCCHS
ncbi:MAG: hypothetical protein JXR70_13605 [Spirochaetales bacterium]|nr:hypothetical protein [Spirochaetales bacterium]